MLSEDDLIINKIAQDKLTLESGLEWFKKFNYSEQKSKLNWLRIYLEQSHPTQELINQSIDKIPLKSTMTPIVILKTNPYKMAATKICNLPDYEIEKGFVALLTLFKFADIKRRETFCKDGCNHEWHNLEDDFN